MLSYDRVRCTGCTVDPEFKHQEIDPSTMCQKRMECERFLSLNTRGPGSTVMLAESVKGCGLFLPRIAAYKDPYNEE